MFGVGKPLAHDAEAVLLAIHLRDVRKPIPTIGIRTPLKAACSACYGQRHSQRRNAAPASAPSPRLRAIASPRAACPGARGRCRCLVRRCDDKLACRRNPRNSSTPPPLPRARTQATADARVGVFETIQGVTLAGPAQYQRWIVYLRSTHCRSRRSSASPPLPHGLNPPAPIFLLTAKPTTQVTHCCRAPPMEFVLYQST